jgi:hypothetical protein
MLVSISEGFCLDGLLGAILLRAGDDILAATSRVIEEVLSCQGWFKTSGRER